MLSILTAYEFWLGFMVGLVSFLPLAWAAITTLLVILHKMDGNTSPFA